MSVVVNLIPTTGITLPLISYGGSSLVATCAAIGVLLNISQHS
jgi:cell division protein FtsW